MTLSSGEAELVAIVKATTEIIGICQLLKDWGMQSEGVILADYSAALGVVKEERQWQAQARTGWNALGPREIRGWKRAVPESKGIRKPCRLVH